jgi:hypothetical protein
VAVIGKPKGLINSFETLIVTMHSVKEKSLVFVESNSLFLSSREILMCHRHAGVLVALLLSGTSTLFSDEIAQPKRAYSNRLTRIEQPNPLLADYPEFFEPITEQAHFEAGPLVIDEGADLHVRAWRFSYNARGIIEMPNHLKASKTAVIMVHPW